MDSLQPRVLVAMFGVRVEFSEADSVHGVTFAVEDSIRTSIDTRYVLELVRWLSRRTKVGSRFEIDEIPNLVGDSGWMVGIATILLLSAIIEATANDGVSRLLSSEEFIDPVVARFGER